MVNLEFLHEYLKLNFKFTWFIGVRPSSVRKLLEASPGL